MAVYPPFRALSPAWLPELAQQVRDAMFNVGFFYVVGHGYSEENVSIFVFDFDER